MRPHGRLRLQPHTGPRGCRPHAVTLPFTQPGSSQPITPPPSSRHRHTQTPPPVHSAQDSASEPLQSVPPAGPASPPPLSPPQGFSSRSLPPSAAISGNWCLTLPVGTLFLFIYFPAAETLLAGELQPGQGRRDAAGTRRQRTEESALRSPQPAPQARPAGRGHEHQAGIREGGGRPRPEGTGGGGASGPSPPEPAAAAQTGHPVCAQGLCRPAPAGQPQEAGHLQGLGEAALSPNPAESPGHPLPALPPILRG